MAILRQGFRIQTVESGFREVIEAMKPRVIQKPDVTAESLPDGSMILFDPADMMVYPISASAALVWTALNRVRTPGEIVDDLLSVYEAPREKIERDTETFIDQLLAIGLLVPASEQGIQTR